MKSKQPGGLLGEEGLAEVSMVDGDSAGNLPAARLCPEVGVLQKGEAKAGI